MLYSPGWFRRAALRTLIFFAFLRVEMTLRQLKQYLIWYGLSVAPQYVAGKIQ